MGPGQYLSQNILDKFQPMKGAEGTRLFNGPPRVKEKQIEPTPGPFSYQKDPFQPVEKDSGAVHPFLKNEKRFVVQDKGVPPPGAYNIPGLSVKEKQKESSFFKSGADKSVEIVIGKNNPGIGTYENYHQQTISNKDFQGGAPNNFVMYTKHGYKLREPDIKEAPRIPEIKIGSSKLTKFMI